MWLRSTPDAERDASLVVSTERRSAMRRDIAGLLPAYYATVGSAVLVANRPELILSAAPELASPDLDVAASYILREHVPGRSFFRDIAILPPGHELAISGARSEVRRYFSLPALDQKLADPFIAAMETRRAIRRAVGRSLRQSCATAIELSGGLDSSSICGVASRMPRQNPLYAVSAGFSARDADEAGFADVVARSLSYPTLTFDGTLVDARNLEDPILERPGGRLVTNFGIGEFTLLKQLGCDALLVGVGGDQVFWDPESFADFVLRGPRLRALSALATETAVESRQRFRAATAALLRRLKVVPRPGVKRRALPDFLHYADLPSLQVRWAPWEDSTEQSRATVNRLLSSGLQDWIGGLSRMWDEVGVEVRYPLLDQEVIRLVLSVPPAGRVLSPLDRSLLRTAMGPILPPSLLKRSRKASFASAVTSYFLRLAVPIRDALSLGGATSALVDVPKVKVVWDDLVRRRDEAPGTWWRGAWQVIAVAHLLSWERATRSCFRT